MDPDKHNVEEPEIISDHFRPDESLRFSGEEIGAVSRCAPIDAETLNRATFDRFRKTMRKADADDQKFVYVDLHKLSAFPEALNNEDWIRIRKLETTKTLLIGPMSVTGHPKDADISGHFVLVVINVKERNVDVYNSIVDEDQPREVYTLAGELAKFFDTRYRLRIRSVPSQRNDTQPNTSGLHVYANMKDVLRGKDLPRKREIQLVRLEVMNRIEYLREDETDQIGDETLTEAHVISLSTTLEATDPLDNYKQEKTDIISDIDPNDLRRFTNSEIGTVSTIGSPILLSTLNKMAYDMFRSCRRKERFLYVDAHVLSSDVRDWSASVSGRLAYPEDVKRFVGAVCVNGQCVLVEIDVARHLMSVYGSLLTDARLKMHVQTLHYWFNQKHGGKMSMDVYEVPSQRKHPRNSGGLNVVANLRDVVEGKAFPTRRDIEKVRGKALKMMRLLRDEDEQDELAVIPRNTKCTLQQPYKIRSTQDVLINPDMDEPQFCHTTILISGEIEEKREEAEIRRAYKEPPKLLDRNGCLVKDGRAHSIEFFVGKHVLILKRVKKAVHFRVPNLCDLELIDENGEREHRQLGLVYTPSTIRTYHSDYYKQEISLHFVFHEPSRMDRIDFEEVDFGRTPLPGSNDMAFLEAVYVGEQYLEVKNRVVMPRWDGEDGFVGKKEFLNLTHARDFCSNMCEEDGSLTVQKSATDMQEDAPYDYSSPSGAARRLSLNYTAAHCADRRR